MSKLDAIKEAQNTTQQMTIDDYLALGQDEEPSNGLCPFRAECYEKLGLTSQHCAWNYDKPPTWQFCGGYKRRKKKL